MVQSIFSILSFTEMSIPDPDEPVTVPVDSETVTEPEIQTNSETPADSESFQTISETESLEELPATETPEDIESELLPYTETVYETVYMTGEYDEQILFELQVTNSLLGQLIALQIFFLACFFLVFFIKLIKNNVTNLFT